jgi:hypothetical protein
MKVFKALFAVAICLMSIAASSKLMAGNNLNEKSVDDGSGGIHCPGGNTYTCIRSEDIVVMKGEGTVVIDL